MFAIKVVDPRHNIQRVTLAIACLIVIFGLGQYAELMWLKHSNEFFKPIVWQIATRSDPSGYPIHYELHISEPPACNEHPPMIHCGLHWLDPDDSLQLKYIRKTVFQDSGTLWLRTDIYFSVPIPFTD